MHACYPVLGFSAWEQLEQGLAFSLHSPPKVGAFVLGTSFTTIRNSLGLGDLIPAVPLVGLGVGTKIH